MLPLYIASKYFFARQKERVLSIVAAFSLIGIALGVATLIVVFAVMRGFHAELVKNIVSLNSDIIVKPNYYITLDQKNNIIEKLKSQNIFIKKISSVVENQALLMANHAKIGAIIKGISDSELSNKTEIITNMRKMPNTELENTNIVIGDKLANNLGVFIGDTVQIISSSSMPSIIGTLPRVKSFLIIGIFSSGMYDYDSSVVFMDINTAETFFTDSVPILEVYTDDHDKSYSYALQIQKQIGVDFNVMSWDMINAPFFHALKVERVTMFTILTLIIFIAAFNIVSSVYILVKNKSKDIAILKTIGMSSKSIMMVFLWNGFMIGFSGVAIGVAIGTILALNVNAIKFFLEKMTGAKIFDAALYYFSNLPSKVYVEDIALIVAISLGFCIVASLYPSYKASQTKVVDIIRNE